MFASRLCLSILGGVLLIGTDGGDQHHLLNSGIRAGLGRPSRTGGMDVAEPLFSRLKQKTRQVDHRIRTLDRLPDGSWIAHIAGEGDNLADIAADLQELSAGGPTNGDAHTGTLLRKTLDDVASNES